MFIGDINATVLIPIVVNKERLSKHTQCKNKD